MNYIYKIKVDRLQTGQQERYVENKELQKSKLSLLYDKNIQRQKEMIIYVIRRMLEVMKLNVERNMIRNQDPHNT